MVNIQWKQATSNNNKIVVIVIRNWRQAMSSDNKYFQLKNMYKDRARSMF